MGSEYSQRVFASQPFRKRASKLLCFKVACLSYGEYVFLTKTTAARNEVTLSYHSVRGLYFLAVVFATTIVEILVEMVYPRNAHVN